MLRVREMGQRQLALLHRCGLAAADAAPLRNDVEEGRREACRGQACVRGHRGADALVAPCCSRDAIELLGKLMTGKPVTRRF